MDENNEIHFVNGYPERKKVLYRNLFNIGTYCIENNFEKGLREVSNTLGWFIIYNLRQGTGQLTTYLIDRANELYILSKKMDISSKTQMFILTLFTTVGTFCCEETKNGFLLYKIYDCIKYVEKEKIHIAIKLRTSENDMWNDLYNNKTDLLTKKFLKGYEDYIKN